MHSSGAKNTAKMLCLCDFVKINVSRSLKTFNIFIQHVFQEEHIVVRVFDVFFPDML